MSEWEAYEKLDPIGTWRDDFRMAFLATIVTNLAISINGKKGAKTVDVMDYMPVWDQTIAREPKKQSVEEMKKIFHDIANTQKKKKKLDIQSKKPPVKRK